MSKGIGFTVFEYRGTSKKKLFEYRVPPKNPEMGIDTFNSKFGFEIKKHSGKLAKFMRR